MMEYDYLKVKKGMVFWYNNFDSEKKENVFIKSTSAIDYRIHGTRPWLVISDTNIMSKKVSAIPLSSSPCSIRELDVEISASNDSHIHCDEIQTINVSQLKDYVFTLSNSVMKKVEDKILQYLGIKHECPNIENTDEFKQLEIVISSLVKSKIEQERQQIEQKNTEKSINAVIKGIQNTFNEEFKTPLEDIVIVESPVKEQEQEEHKESAKTNNVETKNIKEIEGAKVKTPIEERRKRNKGTGSVHSHHIRWDKEKMEEFLHDTETLETDEIITKWGMRDNKNILKTKEYLRKKQRQKAQ